MGEVKEEEEEELRYVCRICSKVCVSGKSLGGHMRVHIAQISASKKAAAAAAAQEKASIKRVFGDDDGEEEKMKQCEEMGDGDQSSSYELRENPRKSWRISDPKRGLIAKDSSINSCRECGKGFASLRALSGHMRCHSIKNKKEVHLCKECGRGFGSIRAMFGHMKSHSKKVKKVVISSVVVVPESAESVSDLENFCPIRRKRSRIRYKGTVNPSFSSNCGVSELQEAARCLVMLSRGVGSSFKLEEDTESSDDDNDDGDSSYFCAVTSCRSEKSCGGGVDFFSDDKRKLNVSEFDDLDLRSVAGGQCSVGELLELAVGSNSEGGGDDESGFVNNFSQNEGDLDMVECFLDKKPNDKERGLGRQNGMPEMVGANSNLHTKAILLSYNEGDGLSFEKNCSENEDDLEKIMEDSFEKKPRCNQTGLGRQNGRSKLVGDSSNQCTNTSLLSVNEGDKSGFDKNCSENGDDLEKIMEDSFEKKPKCKERDLGWQNGRPKMVDSKHDQCSGSVVPLSLESSKRKEHECPNGFKVFSSGQALGGHKRVHYNGAAENNNLEAAEAAREMLDLNFPVSGDAGGATPRLGLDSWFGEISHGHEALVLTT